MIENRIKNLERRLVNKTIQYKNNDITYFTNSNFGQIKNETIILLHPAFSDYRIFLGQFEAWDEKYNLIALDMPGHGKNNSLSRDVTLEDTSYIIEKILDEHGLAHVHLLGVSLGSLVAQGVADKIGDKIKSVTLVGGYSIHKNNKKILKAQNKERAKWIFMIIFAMNKFRAYVSTISTNTKDGQYVFNLGADLFTRKSFPAMQSLGKIFRDTEDTMQYPMLLIVGDQDLPLALDSAKELALIEPNSQLEIIQNSGHCANIDQINQFNIVYEEFLEKI